MVIFTVAGALGFLVSNWVGYPLTIGASGAVFGMLGAIVAFGKKRGGVFGAMVLRQYGYMALLMFVLSYFLPGVNNAAHGGGFVGGLLAGLVLSLAEHRRETALDWVLAAICIAVTVAGVALSLWSAFAH
jgi:rhomboid protease GluP